MSTDDALTLEVVELLHHALDVDVAVTFYRDRLGWPVVWQSPGNMCVLDAGGAYQVTVVAARWVDGWSEGQPAPGPQVALESKDLAADVAELGRRGIPGLVVGGDPSSMLTSAIVDPQGHELFVWQDTTEASATKVVEAYRATRTEAPLYASGGCMLLADDVVASEDFYTRTLGFGVAGRSGDGPVRLDRGQGLALELARAASWRDALGAAPGAAVCLALSCADLEAERERQVRLGAEPGPLLGPIDGWRWFVTVDPDGTRILFREPVDPGSD